MATAVSVFFNANGIAFNGKMDGTWIAFFSICGGVFLKVDNAKFKQKVVPGDTLVFELTLTSPIRRGLVEMKGTAYVNGKVATEADMLAQVIKDKE